MGSKPMPSPLARRHPAVVLAGLSLVFPGVYAESVSLDLVGAVTYDDNLNRAERGNQQQSDAIFTLGAGGSYRLQLGAGSGLIASLGTEAEAHVDFGDLNLIRARTSLTYLMQPVRGFSAPWFALTAAYELAEYAASDIRDGSVASLGAEAGKRFTDRIAVRLGYRLRDRDASKSRVFELRQNLLHVVGDYSVSDRVGAYLKYEYLDGGVVTTALQNPKFRGVTRRAWPDRVFGPGMVAWRLDGETHTLRIGGKYALAKRTALDFAATHSLTEADGDNQWNVWNVGLTLVHRFQ
jgi:hypothetical protein